MWARASCWGLIGFFIMYKKMHGRLGSSSQGAVCSRCCSGLCTAACSAFEHAWTACTAPWALPKAGGSAAADSINTILILSVAAGVFIIVAAILTGVASEMRRGKAVKAVFSVNGLAGLVFYLSLIALLLSVVGIPLPFVGSVPFLDCVPGGAVCDDVFCRAHCAAFRGQQARRSPAKSFSTAFRNVRRHAELCLQHHELFACGRLCAGPCGHDDGGVHPGRNDRRPAVCAGLWWWATCL